MTASEKTVKPVYGRSPYIPRPSRIILSDSCSARGGFGKCEVEVSAGHLVQFMRETKHDSWQMFKLPELAAFYQKQGWNSNEMLDGLTGAWLDLGQGWPEIYETDIFIVNLLGGDFVVTEEFVRRCAGENNKNLLPA